ncbi:hypothetical protein T492DRAFT_894334 [Pavlovales sp. CCMP2436]|nr:hypothetical protein T492DRAFT_894334 [Pavlovales sp. CCMP2436]
MGFGSFDELKASLLDKVRSEPAWKSISAKEASISTVSAPAPGLATSAPPNAVSVLRYDANHGAMVHSLGVRDVADQFSRIRFLHNPRAILRVLLRMTDGCKSFLVYVLRQVGPRGAVLIDTITELWKLANADR